MVLGDILSITEASLEESVYQHYQEEISASAKSAKADIDSMNMNMNSSSMDMSSPTMMPSRSGFDVDIRKNSVYSTYSDVSMYNIQDNLELTADNVNVASNDHKNTRRLSTSQRKSDVIEINDLTASSIDVLTSNRRSSNVFNDDDDKSSDTDEFLDDDIDEREEEIAEEASKLVSWSRYMQYVIHILFSRLGWKVHLKWLPLLFGTKIYPFLPVPLIRSR